MVPLLIIIGTILLLLWLLNASKNKPISFTQGEFLPDQYQKAKELGIPKISKFVLDQLLKIVPSKDSLMEYRPCRVILNSGEVFDNVYISEIKAYLKVWGVLPGIDPAKRSISVKDIAKIEESPNRLPPRLATKLYKAGESGMGYTIFTIVMANGNHIPIVTGNAVDFVSLPGNQRINDIIDVLPHEGRNADPQRGPEYFWCLYEE